MSIHFPGTCAICYKLVKYSNLIMYGIKTIILFSTLLLGFLFYADASFAKTDLSIAENDITFSKSNPLDGDLVRIYARVSNAGDNDVSGYVVFLSNGKEIAEHQPISLKPATYDDVFIDWKVKAGTYNIEAKIAGLNSTDENTGNNGIIKKDFFVDLDTDIDSIGDSKDTDKDNDGLTNEEEITKGTDPLVIDTDGDKVNDKVDVFPLDNTESRDTDSDSIGDNNDTDADGDGITNQAEITDYGTNPLTPDSDNDGINDKQEVQTGTNPNKADTNLINSLTAGLLNAKNAPYLIFGALVALLVLFILFRKKKR